jgi:signal transduction histidine kinase
MKYKDIFATPPSADEDPVAEALKNGPRHGMETTLRALNGQKIRAEISAVPLVVDNKKMVVLAINDISEKERLSRLNKDISRISESNLKSRLDYILDVSAKLKKEMKKLTPRHAEMFDMLERAGKDMMNTIEMSLELGRAEDGALRLYRHKIETEELITEIIKEQKCLLKKKTPEFSLKKDSGDIDIKADKFMFYSMFSGLIKAVLKTVAPENTVLINIKKKRDTLEIKIAAKTSKPVSIPDSSCLIAEEHEGSVNAVFSPRDGSVVTLILPEK